MFHADLVYVRENVKALKDILKAETRSDRRYKTKKRGDLKSPH